MFKFKKKYEVGDTIDYVRRLKIRTGKIVKINWTLDFIIPTREYYVTVGKHSDDDLNIISRGDIICKK